MKTIAALVMATVLAVEFGPHLIGILIAALGAVYIVLDLLAWTSRQAMRQHRQHVWSRRETEHGLA